MAKYFPTNLVQLKNTTKHQKIGLAIVLFLIIIILFFTFSSSSKFTEMDGTCTDVFGNTTISNSQNECCNEPNNQWNSVSCGTLNQINSEQVPVSLNQPPLGGGQFPVIYS